jgi:rhodanese-related sulfurtransferase
MEATVSTKELRAKVQSKEKIKLVETMAPDRYQQGHIPGALNIPPEKVKELAPQLLPDKNAEIITYCANTH